MVSQLEYIQVLFSYNFTVYQRYFMFYLPLSPGPGGAERAVLVAAGVPGGVVALPRAVLQDRALPRLRPRHARRVRRVQEDRGRHQVLPPGHHRGRGLRHLRPGLRQLLGVSL